MYEDLLPFPAIDPVGDSERILNLEDFVFAGGGGDMALIVGAGGAAVGPGPPLIDRFMEYLRPSSTLAALPLRFLKLLSESLPFENVRLRAGKGAFLGSARPEGAS